MDVDTLACRVLDSRKTVRMSLHPDCQERRIDFSGLPPEVTKAVLTRIVDISVSRGNFGRAQDAALRNGTCVTPAQYMAIGDYHYARLGEQSDARGLIGAMSAYQYAGDAGRARLLDIGDRLMVQMTENPMLDFTMEAYLCFEGQIDRLRRVGEIAARLGSTGVAALAYAEAGDSGVAQFFGQF